MDGARGGGVARRRYPTLVPASCRRKRDLAIFKDHVLDEVEAVEGRGTY